MPVDYWLHVCDRSRVEVDMYTESFLTTFEKSDFFPTCKMTVAGKLSWNDWGNCDVSCGGGRRLRLAKECVPAYARCYDLPMLEEPCNPETCPELPSTYLPPGTIIPWVPRPNKSFTESFFFQHDAWIVCDGSTTCKKGMFTGQACSDLSDRALIGAGLTGKLLDVKDASLPDHEHNHKHTGKQTYTINYKRGQNNPPDNEGGQGGIHGGHSRSPKHRHDYSYTTSVDVDFGHMSSHKSPVTNILAPKVTTSTKENDLYPSHMRVQFMFKCY